MASKRITQETFDAAVHENIEEFEMGAEEAVREAVEQFESQGVDLSNIVKTAPPVSLDGLQEPTHDVLQDLVKQVLSALRAIAGNDDVKDAIVRAGGTESIVAAMTRHLASPQVCEQSCAALCVLALRKPENSRVIVEGGGALAALQAMKAHPQEASVQKQACMLIRNLVSRSQVFSKPILDLGAEELILKARAAHPDCEDVAKAALRDLGCRVELRELWTGKRGDLAP